MLWYSADCLSFSLPAAATILLLRGKKRGRVVRPFLMVLHIYWSRPAQCLLVAHHGYWVPCGSRLNCAGSWSRLEPQRSSVHDPLVCGYALALTNPITCCIAGQCIQANARRRELRNQTTLSQLWVKLSHCLVRTRDSER